MRIGQIVKAKKLRKGDRVLILNADGDPSWNTVEDVIEQYSPGYLTVALVGVTDEQEIKANTRVLVWK